MKENWGNEVLLMIDNAKHDNEVLGINYSEHRVVNPTKEKRKYIVDELKSRGIHFELVEQYMGQKSETVMVCIDSRSIFKRKLKIVKNEFSSELPNELSVSSESLLESDVVIPVDFQNRERI